MLISVFAPLLTPLLEGSPYLVGLILLAIPGYVWLEWMEAKKVKALQAAQAVRPPQDPRE